MRYNEILKEDYDIRRFIKIIKNKCSDIIKTYIQEDLFLYRGIRSSDIIISGESKEGRKPIDTPLFLQKLIDDWLTKHNFKALRSNSYYVTGDKTMASDYGDVYIIFPLNGFEFTWFENSNDLFATLEILPSRVITNMDEDGVLSDIYTQKQLEYLTRHGVELDTLEYIYETKYKDYVLEGVNHFMQFVETSDTDLNRAIDSGKEIIITGKYYGISLEHILDNFDDETQFLEELINEI